MARKIRIQFAGACYHIMSRGNKYEDIFISDKDRYSFLKTLGEVCERTGWKIHAYVMMSNHYHLLVETPEANLVDGMRWFQSTYTKRYNGRNKLVGHLFQGRYKDLIMDSSDPEGSGEMDYFLTLSDYIHLNPVRAGLIDRTNPRLSTYKWSSYPYYLKMKSRRPPWLHVEKVFKGMKIKVDNSAGRKRYAQYMDLRVKELLDPRNKNRFEKEWESLRKGWFLGDDKFKEKLLDLAGKAMEGYKKSSYSGETKRLHNERAAEDLVQEALKVLKLDNTQLVEMKKSDPHKQVIAYLLKKKTSVSNIWIAERLSMGYYTAVTNGVRAVKQGKQKNVKKLANKLKILLK